MINFTKKIIIYWKSRGTRLFIKKVLQKLSLQLSSRKKRISQEVDCNEVDCNVEVVTARTYLDKWYFIARPMVTYRQSEAGISRVNIVTDSVRAGSLFGGVGTALLFGVCLSNRLGANLRIITRTEEPDELRVNSFLKLYNLFPEKELQFKFEPCDDGGNGVDFSENDLFVTTSWWTTASTLPSVPAGQIIYLLQEDERMFYPVGDDWIRAHRMMSDDQIHIVVNTELLFEYLVSNGFYNISERGVWFEPAFPSEIYSRGGPKDAGEPKRLFFYARPNNPRNLFRLGLEVIDRALMKRVIDPDRWEIVFVGSDIPDVELFGGVRPVCYKSLSWHEYAQLLGSVDVGVSLMSTPHPSYPPLDLAASGSIVVTNKFKSKRELYKYSENIICSDLDVDSLVSAIDFAVRLSEDIEVRNQNYINSGLKRDWGSSFAKVIDHLVGVALDHH
ncbi:MAG: hypothetical protein WCY67_01335 [Acidithiobacillus sp.]